MELVHNYQVDFNELLNEKFDCIIAASGFQKRSTYLAENIDTSKSENLVITFDETTCNELRLENIRIFQKLGFLSVNAAPDESSGIEKMMHRICSGRFTRILNILVDYSCMPKVWFATIINCLLKNDFHAERINIYFSYTPKKVNTILQKSRLKSYMPLIFGSEKDLGKKPLALVAGFNNNLDIMKEFINKLKPVNTFAFIPYFTHEEEYYRKIMENNASVLRSIPSEKIFRYPAERPDQITSMITSLCLDLRLNSNVILIPQGPKTFGLASVLFSVRYPDVMIYDLKSSDHRLTEDPGFPSGDPVVLKSVFCVEEEEDD
jgi:hypothetical protein